MKQCTKCNKPRELSEFHTDNSRPDGLTPQCKYCRNLHHAMLRDTTGYREQEKIYRDLRRKNPLVKARELETYKIWIEKNKDYLKTVKWFSQSRTGIQIDRRLYKSYKNDQVRMETLREKLF